ncbi:hypothetical protein FRB94_005733 [Tulasnella sp. JGI-2019a]|nr:hypothetical protein FRB94_005733 [Tulasnella sp. JGI-2019a]KAG9000928.1 hypothetical protein FRB93_012533 [Tulasnella sp. JGI-2019a]
MFILCDAAMAWYPPNLDIEARPPSVSPSASRLELVLDHHHDRFGVRKRVAKKETAGYTLHDSNSTEGADDKGENVEAEDDTQQRDIKEHHVHFGQDR